MEVIPVYYSYLYYKNISEGKVYLTLPNPSQEELPMDMYWKDGICFEISNLGRIFPFSQRKRTVLHFKNFVNDTLFQVTAISYDCMKRLLQHLISIGFVEHSALPFLYRSFESEEDKLAREKATIGIKSRFSIMEID